MTMKKHLTTTDQGEMLQALAGSRIDHIHINIDHKPKFAKGHENTRKSTGRRQYVRVMLCHSNYSLPC